MKKDHIEFFRFCIVGIIATATLYGFYWIFLQFANPTLSYSIGYLFAFVVNYLLTTSFTFKVNKSVKNGMGFIVSNIINYFLSICLLNIFLHLGLNDKIAPITTVLLATLSNFVIVRLVMKKL